MKKTVKSYTKNELDFVYFKAKTLAFITFAMGMITSALIYVLLSAVVFKW